MRLDEQLSDDLHQILYLWAWKEYEKDNILINLKEHGILLFKVN